MTEQNKTPLTAQPGSAPAPKPISVPRHNENTAAASPTSMVGRAA